MALDLQPHLERLRKNIGKEKGPLVIEVERGALLKFAAAVGEKNPLYFDDQYARSTRFGGIIAPPTYVSCWVTRLSEQMYDFSTPGLRSLHCDDIAENFVPIRIGDTISATARYIDVTLHEGRKGPMLFQTVDTTLTNQNGQTVSVVRMIVTSFQ
ncbi:MAG: MaoC family dehydratase N-terminal domain-containing protein [Steroidobacteraceae bacterium]